MNLKQHFILMKINAIKPNELIHYANEAQVTLTPEQAEKICSLVAGKNINIFQPEERLGLLKKIARITSPETAKQVNALFSELMNEM